MTTKPESPDSGASAGDQAVAYIPTRNLEALRESKGVLGVTVWNCAGTEEDVPLYTRAQDSGQGEAVAFVVIYPNEVSSLQWANAHGERDDYEDFDERYGQPKRVAPLFSHPPKPAQDAAGKGVDDDFTWWRVEVSDHGGQIVAIEQSLADGVLSGREIGEREEAFVIAAIEHLSGFIGHPAKPAQDASAKSAQYREPNINDTHSDAVDRCFRHGPCPFDRELLDFLKAIGAVVPAQDGGV